jgi:hypothetical protein
VYQDGSYRSISLHPETLIVKPIDFLQGSYGIEHLPMGGSFETRSQRDGDVIITHWERRTTPPFHVTYDQLRVDRNWRLSQRTKLQELSRGPFGVIALETLFRYDHPLSLMKGLGWQNVGTSVMIRCLPLDHPGGEPSGLDLQRPTQTTEPLSAISFIRVLHFAPSLVIAGALYFPDGRLHSLHTSREQVEHMYDAFLTPAGQYITEQSIPAQLQAADELRELFAIPRLFPVKAYLVEPFVFFKDAAYPDLVVLVNLHYGLNRLVHQDTFDPQRHVPTRSILTWTNTEADGLLESHDQRVPLLFETGR